MSNRIPSPTTNILKILAQSNKELEETRQISTATIQELQLQSERLNHMDENIHHIEELVDTSNMQLKKLEANIFQRTWQYFTGAHMESLTTSFSTKTTLPLPTYVTSISSPHAIYQPLQGTTEEKQIDTHLNNISNMLRDLKLQGQKMNKELTKQESIITSITTKVDNVTPKIANNTLRVRKLM